MLFRLGDENRNSFCLEVQFIVTGERGNRLPQKINVFAEAKVEIKHKQTIQLATLDSAESLQAAKYRFAGSFSPGIKSVITR